MSHYLKHLTKRNKIFYSLLISSLVFGLTSSQLFAQEEVTLGADILAKATKSTNFIVHNLWILIAAFMVFTMHLGFSALETGLTRSKNTVNILFKNMMILVIGILTYAIVGFNLMYPDFEANSIIGKVLGFSGFWLSSPSGDAGLLNYADGSYTYWSDFLFQAMFAATAGSIISGSVAERVKLWPFLIVMVFYLAIVYPICGSWKWGEGWLDELGFYDFAGSTLVHSIGGWGALIAVLLLGPRIGKYDSEGGVRPILGHSMPLAAIGVFLLWFGWYGFNGGSVLSADPASLSLVVVNTTLAAAAGVIGALIASLIATGSPDLSMILNGSLAGLVGVTAGADVFTPGSSALVGLLAGLLVVYGVIFFDKLKIDDPVGALSVHLLCGIWGTLAVGIFSINSEHTLWKQFIGVTSIGIFACAFAFVLFMIAKATVGIRVSKEEEQKGLDLAEHGMESYAGFQVFTSE